MAGAALIALTGCAEKQQVAPTPMPASEFKAKKADRTEHGLYIYETYVRKKDKSGKDLIFNDPNDKLVEALSKTQLGAWRAADGTCFVKAAKAIYNRTVKDQSDLWDQYWTMSEAALARELDGNPQLVELAQKFGDCLKSKGVKVLSLQPSKVWNNTQQVVQDEASALAEEQSGQKATGRSFMMPNLSAAEAKPYLEREIKVALDDLECGKDFYAVFLPLRDKVEDDTSAAFGLGRR